MTSLRLIGDWLELDGKIVAQLVPKLPLTIRDKLTEAFDALDEDALYISQLEDRIAEFESRLAAPAPRERQ